MGNITSTNTYMDFFNIIQLAWGIEWIIAGDKAHNYDIFTGEGVS